MTVEFAGTAKAKQLREYFARHGRIYIVVNATDDDVLVPEHLHGDPALRLVLNVRMPQAIIIKDDVLESELSFSGNLFGHMGSYMVHPALQGKSLTGIQRKVAYIYPAFD